MSVVPCTLEKSPYTTVPTQKTNDPSSASYGTFNPFSEEVKQRNKILELEWEVERLQEELNEANKVQVQAENLVKCYEEQLVEIRHNSKEARMGQEKAERLLACYNQELKEIQQDAEEDKIDPSAFDDEIYCDHCKKIMWYPCVLRECGHIFCQKCLGDWFRVITESYVGKHYGPMFSCPMCSDPVTKPPVEVIKMKFVVQIVAAALGHLDPRNNNPDPWSIFFSKAEIMDSYEDEEVDQT